eukprot:s815_g9.t1
MKLYTSWLLCKTGKLWVFAALAAEAVRVPATSASALPEAPVLIEKMEERLQLFEVDDEGATEDGLLDGGGGFANTVLLERPGIPPPITGGDPPALETFAGVTGDPTLGAGVVTAGTGDVAGDVTLGTWGSVAGEGVAGDATLGTMGWPGTVVAGDTSPDPTPSAGCVATGVPCPGVAMQLAFGVTGGVSTTVGGTSLLRPRSCNSDSAALPTGNFPCPGMNAPADTAS